MCLEGGTSSAKLLEGVLAGREYASWRRQHDQLGTTTQDILASCHMDEDDARYLETMAELNHMSGRAIVRTVSVARTIADMECRESVTHDDINEALGFRLREGVGQ